MPGLNIDLSVKYKQILKAFQTEIQTVAAIYEKNKHDPEILRNISPVAGRIGWVRQLYRRIETPMMAFSKMSDILKVSSLCLRSSTAYSIKSSTISYCIVFDSFNDLKVMQTNSHTLCMRIRLHNF